MSDTRYTRAIEVGVFQDKVGFTMHFDDGREHFLFDRATARRLAANLFHILEALPTPTPPAPALGISVAEDIVMKERLG